MPYCTRADLDARFGADAVDQLIYDAATGAPSAARLAQAIADADAEIDGYLAVRYTLPLPTVPTVLARIACDVVRHRLMRDQASEEVRRRYEDARRMLEGIAAGRVSLGLPGTATPPVPSLASVSTGAARVFGRGNTGCY